MRSWRVSCSAVDEIAVEGQLPNERVDLPQRQRRHGPAVEVALQEGLGGHAEFERGGGGVFDDSGTTVLPGEREDAEDASDAGGAVVAADVVTDGGTGPLGGGEQGEGLRRGAGGPVRVRDAMPAPWRTQVLAEELAGARVEQPDVGVVPLHVDAAADPAGRRTVVGRRDLDAAVQMHVAAAVLAKAKRLERQRAERRAFLGEHGGDLAFGRVVDAGIGPALLPAVQILLEVVEHDDAHGASIADTLTSKGVLVSDLRISSDCSSVCVPMTTQPRGFSASLPSVFSTA